MAIHQAPATTRQLAVASPGTALLTLLGLTLSLSVVLVSLRPAAPSGPGAPAAPTPTVSPTPTSIATPDATPRPSPTPSPTPTLRPSPVPTPPATPAATVVPTLAPVPSGPPACVYTDVLTPHHGYADWPISMLDTVYHLPSGYAPADLVDSASAGLNGGYLLRGIVAADLRALAADARANGTPIQLVSGYRSYVQQEATFQHWVSTGGYDQALRTSARAGHSEHQLGTVVDVTSEGGAAPWEQDDWATTPAGAWMAANAWRYGFVMSYPRGSFDQTCYDYEPWHYRYVGRDLAERIHSSGRVPRLVLWELQ